MNVYVKTLIPLLFILAALTAPAAYAAATVTVTTDKRTYSPGETVTITGFVKEGAIPIPSVWVNVEVKDPSGKLAFTDVVKTASDGSFKTSFRLAQNAAVGVYTVKAYYGGSYGQTAFEVSTAPVVQVLSLTAEKTTLVVPAGWYDSVVLTVSSGTGYRYNVTLTVASAGRLTLKLTKSVGVPDFTAVLVVYAPLDAVKDVYTVNVTATGADGTVRKLSLTAAVVDTPEALSEVSAKLEDVADRLDKLDTDLNKLNASTADLKADLEDVRAQVANVSAKVEQVSLAMSEGFATVNSKLDGVSSAVNETKGAVGGISAAVYAAAILALIAAVAAIYSVVTITKKLAG